MRDLAKDNLRLQRLLVEHDLELDVVRDCLQKGKYSSGEVNGGGVPDQLQDLHGKYSGLVGPSKYSYPGIVF